MSPVDTANRPSSTPVDTPEALLAALRDATSVEAVGAVLTAACDGLLGCPYGWFLQFDDVCGKLRPTARTDTARTMLRSPPESTPRQGAPWQAFLGSDPVYYDEVTEPPFCSEAAATMERAVLLPLSAHGVLVAGTDDASDGFEESTVASLGDAGVIALDRVSATADRDRYERRLASATATVDEADRAASLTAAVADAVSASDEPESLYQALADLLVDEGPFTFAWVGVPEATRESLAPTAWAGDGTGYLDAISTATDQTEPAAVAYREGAVEYAANVVTETEDGAWRPEALRRGYQSVLSVPVRYGDVTYAVVSGYASSPSDIDERTRRALAVAGGLVGLAVNNYERRDGLLLDRTTSLEFVVADGDCLLTRLTSVLDGVIEVEGVVDRSGDAILLFIAYHGEDLERLDSLPEEFLCVTDVRVLSASDGTALLKLDAAESFVGEHLAEHGLALDSLVVDGTEVRLTVDVPEHVPNRTAVDLLESRFEDVTIEAERDRPGLDLERGRKRSIDVSALTERQREIGEAALRAGFFEWPRRVTGEELADVVGVSSPTLHRHLRRVEKHLFEETFDE